MTTRTTLGRVSPLIAALTILAMSVQGCATGRQTGALGGGGLGALLGGIFGGWEGAAIGTAVGAGAGYIIGNEADIAKAKKMESVPASELVPFAGTRWELTDYTAKTPLGYEKVVLDFMNSGTLTSLKTEHGGLVTTTQERYRVVGGVLIVNKTGYVMNINYVIDGDNLHLTDKAQDRKATFRRIG